MQAIISTFHIDWSSILAQMLNFAVVVGVLWYFAFKPLAQALQKRAGKIEQSLKDAEAITKKLEAANADSNKIVITAKQQADQIIKDARVLADSQREQAVAKVRDQSTKIVAASKVQIEQMKSQAMADASAQLGEIVAKATEAVIGKKMTDASDRDMIEKVLEQAKRL